MPAPLYKDSDLLRRLGRDGNQAEFGEQGATVEDEGPAYDEASDGSTADGSNSPSCPPWEAPQWNGIRGNGEERRDNEDTRMGDASLDTRGIADTINLTMEDSLHEPGTECFDPRTMDTRAAGTVDETPVTNEVSLMAERIQHMPLHDLCWNPSLSGMPPEKKDRIFEYAVTPSSFNPEINLDPQTVKQFGKFAMQLQLINKEANERVAETLIRKVLWVKLVVRHAYNKAEEIKDIFSVLRQDTMSMAEDALEGRL